MTGAAAARGHCGPLTLAGCAEMDFRDLPVADRIRRLTDLDVQVADVPAGASPARARSTTPPSRRRSMGYGGTIGLEAFASDDPEEAVGRFRAAFTVG